jgi:hypothetical protein
MHVAKIPNRNSSPTYLLRESFRENGKVKNRTLGNITSLGVEKIALIAQVLKGEKLVPAIPLFLCDSRTLNAESCDQWNFSAQSRQSPRQSNRSENKMMP